MTHAYKIRSVNAPNGTFIVEFDGLEPMNCWIPYNENGFLEGEELESAIQNLYPWDVQQKEMFASFTNASDIEALVTPIEPTPITAEQARTQRQVLLLQSDWTQLADCPLSPEKQVEWATYRAELRAIPEQSGFPTDIVWPDKPAA